VNHRRAIKNMKKIIREILGYTLTPVMVSAYLLKKLNMVIDLQEL
jgi:uncharacterized membrane protein